MNKKKNQKKYKGSKPLTFVRKDARDGGFSNQSPVTHTRGERERKREREAEVGGGTPASQPPADPHDTTAKEGKVLE